MRKRVKFRVLVAVFVVLPLTGCSEGETDRQAEVLDEAVEALGRDNTVMWRRYRTLTGELKELQASCKTEQAREIVGQTIAKLKFYEPGIRAMPEAFVQERVKDEINQLKCRLKGIDMPGMDKPWIGIAAPQELRPNDKKELWLKFAGWNLDNLVVAEKLRFYAKGKDGERELPPHVIHTITPYQLDLLFHARADTGLSTDDTALVAKWDGRVLFELPVISTQPPKVTEVETPASSRILSERVRRVPHPNGKRGDADLHSDDDRSKPARVRQQAWVTLGLKENVITARLKVRFMETSADHTCFESETRDLPVYKMSPHGTLVNQARDKLALPPEYADAKPEILAIVSPTTGEADIPEYTLEQDTAGENGCVAKWWFDGDVLGTDESARVQVRLKPIRVRLAFAVPAHFVGLEVPGDRQLDTGIQLE